MLSTITLRSPEEATEIARLILNDHKNRRVFALTGELGAGKTTLIKAFCDALGVTDSLIWRKPEGVVRVVRRQREALVPEPPAP